MNRMRLVLVFSLLAISAKVTCASFVSAPPLVLTSLLPAAAQSIKEVKQKRWTQLSFIVNRDYPKYAFEELKLEQWVKAGWIKCSTSSEWLSFPDYSKSKETRTYQRSIYLAKNDELIILNGSYQSHINAFTNPDSNIQYGLIRWSKMTKEEKILLCPNSL